MVVFFAWFSYNLLQGSFLNNFSSYGSKILQSFTSSNEVELSQLQISNCLTQILRFYM